MCYTALVLTMIFTMGEQVPYHHYGRFCVKLLGFIRTPEKSNTFINLLFFDEKLLLSHSKFPYKVLTNSFKVKGRSSLTPLGVPVGNY